MLDDQSRKHSLIASLTRSIPGTNRQYFSTKLLHPEHIRPLTLDIPLTHIDGAIKAEPGCHRGRGHAMLTGSGLRNHSSLPHRLRH